MKPEDRLKREAGERLSAQVRSTQARHEAESQRKAMLARSNIGAYTPQMGLPAGIYEQMVAKARELQKAGKIETVEQARVSEDVANALATARAQLGIEDPTLPGVEHIPVFDPAAVEPAPVPVTVKSKHR